MTDFPDWTSPATGYASLTGPGQTATPGALTQEGGFEVLAGTAAFSALVDGTAHQTASLTAYNGGHVDLIGDDTSGVTIQVASGEIELLSTAGDIRIQCNGTAGEINIFVSPAGVGASAVVGVSNNTVSLQANSAISMEYGVSGGVRGQGAVEITDAADPAHACWLYTCFGNPNGVVSALSKGAICFDTSTPGIWVATASGSAGWTMYTLP